MFDRPAAVAAARKVLEAAPTLEGSDAPIFDLGELVDAVVAAANPDALVIPAYDAVGAPTAEYPLLYVGVDDTDLSGGSVIRVQALDPVTYGDIVEVGMVKFSLSLTDGTDIDAMLRAEGAYHFGLATLSASVQSHRNREVKG